MTPKVITPGTRGFYGWFALAGVMLTSFVTIGAFLISFGIFLPVICHEMGWSRAAVSTGFTLGLICNGLPGPLWGFLVARFGPRANIILGSALVALALAGMSLIQEAWHISIFYSLAGLGVGLSGMVATSTLVNNWFLRKRSLALGIMVSAGCLGGFAFPPLITILISSVGWRISWLVLAGIVLVGASLVGGLILIRNRPEDMGQVPDGEPAGSYEETETADLPSGAGGEPTWQLKQVVRSPTTWLIAAFTVFYAFALGTTGTHQVAYIQDLGFSPMIAATTLSLVSATSIAGCMGFGTLALRFDIRYLACICFGMQTIALGILLTSDNIALIYIYAVLYGIGNGSLLVAMPTFVGAYYGRACYSQVIGIISPFQVVAQAGAATIAGIIYDTTNTYTPAFILITALSLVGLICTFLARQPELPRANG